VKRNAEPNPCVRWKVGKLKTMNINDKTIVTIIQNLLYSRDMIFSPLLTKPINKKNYSDLIMNPTTAKIHVKLIETIQQ